MEQRTIESIIKDMVALVKNKSAKIDPIMWVDAALYLQILKFDAQEERLMLEINAKKIFKDIRATTQSAVDAKIDWETTPEWQEWQRKEQQLKEVLEFVRIAKKEAELRQL